MTTTNPSDPTTANPCAAVGCTAPTNGRFRFCLIHYRLLKEHDPKLARRVFPKTSHRTGDGSVVFAVAVAEAVNVLATLEDKPTVEVEPIP